MINYKPNHTKPITMNLYKILCATLFISLILVFTACKDDEVSPEEVTVSDFETTIDENPRANAEIGTVIAVTTQGELTFELINQTPANALSIDPSSGQLTIADSSLFDFELHPTITAKVVATANGTSKEADITIRLNDVNERIISIKDGLVAYFTFDGTLEDSTGNLPDAKIIGSLTTTTNRYSEPDKAYAFDGSGHIEISNNNLLVNEDLGFSVSIWAKATTTSSQQSLISKAFDYQILVTPATFNLPTGDFYWAIGGDDIEKWADSRRLFMDRVFRRSFWHHYTVVFTKTKVKSYVDGVLKSSVNININQLKNSGFNLIVGAKEYPDTDNISNYFKGSIDDLRYFNKALSDSEVSNLSKK